MATSDTDRCIDGQRTVSLVNGGTLARPGPGPGLAAEIAWSAQIAAGRTANKVTKAYVPHVSSSLPSSPHSIVKWVSDLPNHHVKGRPGPGGGLPRILTEASETRRKISPGPQTGCRRFREPAPDAGRNSCNAPVQQLPQTGPDLVFPYRTRSRAPTS